jgi:dihydropteroate synthase
LLRKLFTWKLKNREIRLGDRTLIAGVLNVTPDSFSDGGLYQDPDRAFARALALEEQGADIIDIGAESTRPGSARISAAEEIRRLIPVLKRLKGELRVPISVDTYKAEVAELAIEHGAEIINDPSGFTWDPLIAKAVVQSDAGLILNHMRGTPETWAKLGPLPDVMLAIAKDLDASISRARRAGVDRLKIVIDPGIGFGKRKEQNAEILARLHDLAKLDYPVLAGPSRKAFLTQGTERETLFATAAAVTAAVLAGAHIVRVHDVAEMKAVLAVADEVLRASMIEIEPEGAPKRPFDGSSRMTDKPIDRPAAKPAALRPRGLPSREPRPSESRPTESRPNDSRPVRDFKNLPRTESRYPMADRRPRPPKRPFGKDS